MTHSAYGKWNISCTEKWSFVGKTPGLACSIISGNVSDVSSHL